MSYFSVRHDPFEAGAWTCTRSTSPALHLETGEGRDLARDMLQGSSLGINQIFFYKVMQTTFNRHTTS